MSDPNCYGCTCVKNYNDETEFCGRIVRDKRGARTIGCQKTCPQCKRCQYELPKKKSETTTTTTTTTTQENASQSKSLGENDFIKFLKQQNNINSGKSGVYGVVSENQNSGSQSSNSNQASNQYQGRNNNLVLANNFDFDMNNNNSNNNQDIGYTVEAEKKISCLEQDMGGCTIDKGCHWNNESIICENLKVIFYSAEKLEGASYTMTVGNYDISDIDNFDFYPNYIAVPYGLRVKIWHKESFVGLFDAYLGNHKPSNLEDAHLYEIKKLGSIQVCNMVSCNKPSPYSGMKLVNIMDGNNVDRIDKTTVQHMGEYKNKLRKNIISRIKYIKATQHECIQEVINYLRHNGINIHKNFIEENDVGTLQKIKFLLNNMPSCQELLVYKNYKNPNEEKRIAKIINENCSQNEDGDCVFESNLAPAYDNSSNLLRDLDIDNNMIHHINNRIEEEKKGFTPSPSNSNNNNNNNNNNANNANNANNNNNNNNNANNNKNNNNNINNNNNNNNNANNNKNNNNNSNNNNNNNSNNNNNTNNSNNNNNNNNSNNNNNTNNSNNNRQKLRSILEKVKLIKQKKPEKEIVYVQSPAETIIQQAPAETIYITTPAETKVVYEQVPGETVYVNAPGTECDSVSNSDKNTKLFGINTKKSPLIKKFDNFLSNKIYKQVSLIFIFLTLFALYIKRRR